MTLTTDLYRLETLTNLHAGAGDSNYGIVDKEVQRDPLNKTPIIHASGLKGALREYLAAKFDSSPDANGNKGDKHETVVSIFGNDSKRNRNEAIQQGRYDFHDARLLALPVRSNHQPFYQATCPFLLLDFVQQLQLFGARAAHQQVQQYEDFLDLLDNELELPKVLSLPDGLEIDEYMDFGVASGTLKEIIVLLRNHGWLGPNPVVFPDKIFKEICERLPVIARNNLENGISQNLWYEEVVPRRSLFYSFVIRPAGSDLLNRNLPETGVVQVGANATIGYGQCRFQRI